MFDVIVIGGGVMGCSTAFQLASRGVKVAVIEKGIIGDGPSGESSAIVRQHYSNELTARMAKYGVDVCSDFDDRVGGACGFTRTGFIVVVDGKDREGLEANVALQQGLGIQTDLVSAEGLQEIMPWLETSDLVVGAFEPDSGYTDPYLTVQAYAAAARREGAEVLSETKVTGLRLEGGKVIGVDTDRDSYDTPIVVNCSGAWGAQVADLAGITVPISSCRVQVAFFRRPDGYTGDHPVVADFINAAYFRSETGDLTLVGLIDPAEAEAVVDPDNYGKAIDFDFVGDIGERLVSRLPAIAEGESARGYASLYAITPDWHPIVDELIPNSGLYICSGFSGHGFKLSPAVGVMTADLVTGTSDPEFDPTMFRFARFEEDDQVRGQYEYSIVG
jgi:glycine/D-amino acid oxidase-like deaminating enzyme